MSSNPSETLKAFYAALSAHFGPQHWWPGETPTEVIVGAILTQNTNWQNVERAISRLREAGCLDWVRLRDLPENELAELIRPAGYYNVKARRLKNFVRWLWDAHRGDLAELESLPLPMLREELLSINGIGRETADSILLYALGRPTFVIDAYTHRVLQRHRIVDGEADYEAMKELMESALPADAGLFNEYHALFVAVGKAHCRPRARCEGCPLAQFEHDEIPPG